LLSSLSPPSTFSNAMKRFLIAHARQRTTTL
jgi:hypothetical protein